MNFRNYKWIEESFDSVSSMCMKLEKAQRVKGADDSSEDGSERFTGTKSYKEANDLALYGDSASASKIKRELKKLDKSKAATEQRLQARVRRSVVGSRPCVPAAIIGHPMAMYRRDKIVTKKPVVTVYYAMTACCGVKTESIINAGAKFAQAVQMVERNGVRVNLYAGNIAKSSGVNQIATTFVRIKDSNKDLDIERMAYALVNPSFLRRHWFKWQEVQSELDQAYWAGSNYGTIVETSELPEIAEHLRLKHRVDVLVSYQQAHEWTAEELANRILGK